jgi:thiol-disulfide isomerase/thioredoxin
VAGTPFYPFLLSSWCKPCHRIQPTYEILSSHYAEQAKFFTIDVDEYDEIAGQYNIAMMPTFLVLEGKNVLGKYNGSNERELQRFLKEQLGRSE